MEHLLNEEDMVGLHWDINGVGTMVDKPGGGGGGGGGGEGREGEGGRKRKREYNSTKLRSE